LQGKTTLLERVKHVFEGEEPLSPDRIMPTVGLNIGRIDTNGKGKLLIWDLGGQKSLRGMWEKYYDEAHALLYVLDAAAEGGKMEETKEAFSKVLVSERLEGAPIMVVANKQDKAEALSKEDVKRILELEGDIYKGHQWLVQPMSALNGAGVEEGMFWLVDAIRRSPRTSHLEQSSRRS